MEVLARLSSTWFWSLPECLETTEICPRPVPG